MDLTRTYRFSAPHRMLRPELPARENERLFGKDVRLHGHDYGLDVTVRGPLDPATGRAVDRVRLDALVRRRVVDRLDHQDLGRRLPLPSGENLARAVWALLEAPVAALPARLVRIGVKETRRNRFEYLGPRPGQAGEASWLA